MSILKPRQVRTSPLLRAVFRSTGSPTISEFKPGRTPLLKHSPGGHGHNQKLHGRWASSRTPYKVDQRFIDAAQRGLDEQGLTQRYMRSQLDRLYQEAVADGTAEVSKRWYEEAHDGAHEIAQLAGVSDIEGAMILAALSPQNPWISEKTERVHGPYKAARDAEPIDAISNVALARRVSMIATGKWGNDRMVITSSAVDKWHASQEKQIRQGKGSPESKAKRLASLEAETTMYRRYVGLEMVTSKAPTAVIANFHPAIRGLSGPSAKAIGIIRNEGNARDYLSGFKVQSFAHNMIHPRDSVAVTIDTHMMRAMVGKRLPKGTSEDKFFASVFSSGGRYMAFSNAVSAEARRRGMTPSAYQAVIWHAQRSSTGLPTVKAMVLKHSPGGHGHNQKAHGRRGSAALRRYTPGPDHREKVAYGLRLWSKEPGSVADEWHRADSGWPPGAKSWNVPNPAERRQAALALRWELEHNAKPNEVPLFRGARTGRDEWSSWTSEPGVANRFGPERVAPAATVRRLEPGQALGIRAADYGVKDSYAEREWIAMPRPGVRAKIVRGMDSAILSPGELKLALGKALLFKHSPGGHGHDQKRHGRRYGGGVGYLPISSPTGDELDRAVEAMKRAHRGYGATLPESSMALDKVKYDIEKDAAERSDFTGYPSSSKPVKDGSARIVGERLHKDYPDLFPSEAEGYDFANQSARHWAKGSSAAEYSIGNHLAAQRLFGNGDMDVVTRSSAMDRYHDLLSSRGFTEAHFDAYMKTTYALTQERLAPLADKHGMITLFRGKRISQDGQHIITSSNPLSSWTTDPRIAGMFGTDLMAASIPIAKIVSLPGLGIGCIEEREVLVAGATGGVRAVTQRLQKSVLLKHSPGGHGHDQKRHGRRGSSDPNAPLYLRTVRGPAMMTVEEAKAAGFTEGPFYHGTTPYRARQIARGGFVSPPIPWWERDDPGAIEEYEATVTARPVFMTRNRADAAAYSTAGGRKANGAVIEVMVRPGSTAPSAGFDPGAIMVPDPRNVVPVGRSVAKATLTLLKHSPGGLGHDQKRHGRRNARPGAGTIPQEHSLGPYVPESGLPKGGEYVWEEGTGHFAGRKFAVAYRANHDELVSEALHSWKGDPVQFRLHIQADERGDPWPGSGGGKMMRAQARALRWELENNSKPNDRPLYRGSRREWTDWAGWTTRRAVARKFDDVVRVLPKGAAMGIRIRDYIQSGLDAAELEWIAKPAAGVRAEVLKASPLLKHHPGGHGHPQKNHGRRLHGKGLGPELQAAPWTADEALEALDDILYVRENYPDLFDKLAEDPTERIYDKGSKEVAKAIADDPEVAESLNRLRGYQDKLGEKGLSLDEQADLIVKMELEAEKLGFLKPSTLRTTDVDMALRDQLYGYRGEWGLSSSSVAAKRIQAAIGQEFGLPVPERLTSEPILGSVSATALDRAYVRATYAYTQSKLAKVEGDYITLYRGKTESDRLGGSSRQVGKTQFRTFDDVEIRTSNPLTSWSTQVSQGGSFAGFDDGGTGAVYRARVHKSRIFSLSTTGLGDDGEFEVTVIGGSGRATAMTTARHAARSAQKSAPLLKHHPGGHSHNQKTHGRRGSVRALMPGDPDAVNHDITGEAFWIRVMAEDVASLPPEEAGFKRPSWMEPPPPERPIEKARRAFNSRVADEMLKDPEFRRIAEQEAAKSKISAHQMALRYVNTYGEDYAHYGSGSRQATILHDAFKAEFGLGHDSYLTAQWSSAKKLPVSPGEAKAARVFARAQYNTTQHYLAKAGVETVTLHRGKARDLGDGVRSFTTNPISSWSTDPGVADHFARVGLGGSGGDGVRLSVVAHRSAIVAFGQAGFGTEREHEVVLLGRGGTARMTRVKQLAPGEEGQFGSTIFVKHSPGGHGHDQKRHGRRRAHAGGGLMPTDMTDEEIVDSLYSLRGPSEDNLFDAAMVVDAHRSEVAEMILKDPEGAAHVQDIQRLQKAYQDAWARGDSDSAFGITNELENTYGLSSKARRMLGNEDPRKLAEQMVLDRALSWKEATGTPAGRRIQQAVADEFGLPAPARGSPPTAFDRAFVRAMYAHTQAELAKTPGAYLTLYRGKVLDPGEFNQVRTTAKPIGIGHPLRRPGLGLSRGVDIKTGQPLSSWSSDPGIASWFATSHYKGGDVLIAKVPKSSVFSIARFGFGDPGEQEYLLIGGSGKGDALLMSAKGVLKHHPGGHGHDQKTHGHRSGVPATAWIARTDPDTDQLLDTMLNDSLARFDADKTRPNRLFVPDANRGDEEEETRYDKAQFQFNLEVADEMMKDEGFRDLVDRDSRVLIAASRQQALTSTGSASRYQSVLAGESLPLHPGARIAIDDAVRYGRYDDIPRIVAHNYSTQMQERWLANNGSTVGIQGAAQERWGGHDSYKRMAMVHEVREPRYGERVWVGSTYNITQDYMARSGAGDLVLHRGKSMTHTQAPPDGDRWEFTSNPLSSWSSDVAQARNFAITHPDGFVLSTKQYADTVFLTGAHMGRFYREEREFIMTGVGGEAHVSYPSEKAAPVQKHHPGGNGHNQKLHGRRGSGGITGPVKQYSSDEGYAFHDENRAWAEGLPDEDQRAIISYAGMSYSGVNSVLRGENMPTTYERVQLSDAESEKFIAWMRAGEGNRGPRPTGPNGEHIEGPMRPFHYMKEVPHTSAIESYRKEAERLDNAFANHGIPLAHNTELLRGTYIRGMSPSDLQASVGKTLHEPGFLSTMIGDANGRWQGYPGAARNESMHRRGIKLTDDEVGVAVRMRIEVPKGTKVLDVEAVRRYSGRYPQPDYRGESELLLPKGSNLRIKSVQLNVDTHGGDSTRKIPVHEVVLEYVP